LKNLLTAIYNKTLNTNLSSYVGGRIYLDRAIAGAQFPYVVYFIVSGVPDKTFTEDYEEILIQFSLFSTLRSATEITTMYKHLTDLFDECELTIPPTGQKTDTLVWMKRENLTAMIEDVTVNNAMESVRHWAVEYEILTSKV
jgi:hypothetical protein